jgi:hypothetical protein
MVIINLFPWREAKKRYENRALKKILWCVFLFTTTVNLILYGVMLHKEQQARLRLAVIKRELKRYAALQMRMEARTKQNEPINQIKLFLAQQAKTKNFFTHLSASDKADVCFTAVSGDQSKISFEGKTRSAADLSQFFSLWPLSDFFAEIRIEKLEQRSAHESQFQFQAFPHAL